MKTKHILLTTAFLILTTISKAQDKYEFMTIAYTFPTSIVISINGKELLKEELDLNKDEHHRCNTNPLLKKIDEYQNQNWEVMTMNEMIQPGTANLLYFAHLRKKKN